MRAREHIMHAVFLAAALASIAAVALICLFLFVNGVPAMAEIGLFDFLLGDRWAPLDVPAAYGIFPMLLGSLYITAGAIAVGVPIGVLSAVFLARFCPAPLYRPLRAGVNLLAGIPSVVFGFFGLIVVTPLVRNLLGGSGQSIVTASILLGVMVLPTVVGVTETALRTVPPGYYEGALALGASHERAVFFVVLPAARSGVLTAIVLGIGRAIGETMAVIAVAGNQTRIPGGLLDGVRTLTGNIVIEMGYAAGLHREALIATGVVLFVFILLINLALSLLRKGGRA